MNQLIKFKSRFTSNTGNDSIVNVEIALSLKCLDNFWITLKMPSINYEISFILTWSANCDKLDRGTSFATTDTKLYVLVLCYQFKIIQNYYNNWNQESNTQLTGTKSNRNKLKL